MQDDIVFELLALYKLDIFLARSIKLSGNYKFVPLAPEPTPCFEQRVETLVVANQSEEQCVTVGRVDAQLAACLVAVDMCPEILDRKSVV